MSNFIPNETILVDDRDPPWITRKLKSMIQVKNLFCKKYLKRNNQETFKHFLKFRNQSGWQLRIPRKSIMKNFHINSRMIDKLNGKCYWTNLKCFFNGENSLHTPHTS